jgi:hypothetical protein
VLVSLRVGAEGLWDRHVIDASSGGADGARLADMNGDGLLDVVTPCEEGGRIGGAFHPGVDAVTKVWPSVEMGGVGNPEDAVGIDVDGDGRLDVVSSCEGGTRSIFVHWAPESKIGVDGFGGLGDGGVACFGGDDAVYVYGGAGRERVWAC